MNRRKKINQILKKRAKQANSKVSGKKKPAYISKAERTATTSAEQTATSNTDSSKDTQN